MNVFRAVLLTVITAGVIIYGSLYPFEFRIPVGGIGPIRSLLQSWAAPPGRGDFVANILLYVPLGWFGSLCLSHRMGIPLRLLLVTMLGSALSISLEMAQYFDAGRVTAADDVYANALGTLLGSLGATGLFGRWHLPLQREITDRPIPAALLLALVGYRLYPYVPTVDLHKYWNALKPVLLYPSFSPDALYRHTVLWLTSFALIEAVVGPRRCSRLALAFCAGILAARVLIVDTVLSVGEIAGAIVSLCLWPIMLALTRRRRVATLFALLGLLVIFERLRPFEFQSVGRDFGWVPFRSLVAGSIAVGVMAFFEKCFLYGSLLYLFTEAGGRLRTAVLVVSSVLLATSWAEVYLPGRSAEITDTVMVLLLAGGFALTTKSAERSG